MKKILLAFVIFFLSVSSLHAQQKLTEFQSKGDVMSVDPMYGRITIKHGAIKGFSGDTETEFFVNSSGLLQNITKGDLVEFTIMHEILFINFFKQPCVIGA